MSLAAWDATFAPARLAAEVLGFGPSVVSVIQMQFLREKGDAYWEAYPHVADFNFSNTFVTAEQLASPGAGIAAYVWTLLISNPTDYGPFVAAGRADNAQAAAETLADSPWASPPYGGSFVAEWKSMKAVPEPLEPDESEPSPRAETGTWVTVTADSPAGNSPDGTLWGIARGHGVPIQKILALNPGLTLQSVLQPGQQIRIA